MMNRFAKIILLTLVTAGLISQPGCSNADQKPAVQAAPGAPALLATSINVKDFGAKGDGKTDDTHAIQAAVAAFILQYQKQALHVKHWDNVVSGVFYHAQPEIVFPSGTYCISEPIVFASRYANMRGAGNAVVKQTDPTKIAFYFHSIWQARVQNMHFTGGYTQLQFWTENKDGSQVSLEHCSFADSQDYAVVCTSFTKNRLEGKNWTGSKPWAPYDVKWESGQPVLTPNNADNLEYWNNSTVFSISNCRFDNCMRAADLSCDTSVICDTDVRANSQTEGPVFKFLGKSHLYHVQGIANPAPDKHPYWIECSAILSVRNSDFETNQPSGIGFIQVPINPYREFGWVSIIVENCRMKIAGSLENAVVWISKKTQPNIISLSNVTETSGKPVNAVTWESTSDLAHLADFKPNANALLDAQYKIQLSGNSPNIDTALPQEMQHLLVNSIPDKALVETFVPELSWNFDDLEKGIQHVLYAKDFGVDTDPATDDTSAIQKTFDAAAQKGNCLIIFPGTILKVSDTIQIPAHVMVRGAGMGVFVQTDPDKDIFHVDGAEKIGFENCSLEGGRDGVNITTQAVAMARVAFKDCNFFDQHRIGLHCLAGQGKTGEANHTELLFEQGMLGTLQGISTNADRSELNTFWATNDPHLNGQAFIENLGGVMRVQSMLGVPRIWQGKVSKAPPDIKDWQYSKNTRWFDNWGQLYVLDSRFGGESGGMCNVFNRASTGTIYIDGGITRFYNEASKNAIVYLEEDSKATVLQNISSVPVIVNSGTRILRLADHSGYANVFVSGVMAP